MSDQLSEDRAKVVKYLRVLQNRIIAPIQNTEIQNYCTATLLLLFAAINGLGVLLYDKDKIGVTPRIEAFLDYMGGDYKLRKKELLRLRHSLVHNAINVESYLSQTETASDQHLKKIGAAGFIYVNTMVMYKDFVDAFEQYTDDIQHDTQLMKRAADRLELRDDDAFEEFDIPGVATPSPAPPVEFIFAKEIGSQGTQAPHS